MAQFQKLKVDTTAQHKPVASTFASIPRQAVQRNGSNPSILGLAGRARGEEGDGNGHFYTSSSAQVGSGFDDVDDIEARFRNRTTSISFDDAVTLDSGNRIPAEGPLPRFTPLVSDPEDSPTEEGYIDLGRKDPLRHQLADPRYPPLLAGTKATPLPQPDQIASLTSDRTISPVLEEVQTPPDNKSQFALSPQSASSPIEFPSFFSKRTPSLPQRTRSSRSELDGEGRRSSRKSSVRSGRSMSSMSPAASFLSRYNTGPLKPTEPDDEGQGIGNFGEYIIGKQIGYGGFSVVKEVTTMEDGKSIVHAVKIVRKQLTDKSELENEQIQTHFDHEVAIWRFLHHPYILPLLCVYTTDFATFCITRLNKGGTLFDLIRDAHKKKKRGLDQHLAKRYTYQLASAIRHLHNDVQLVHRDIKLENCLVDMTGPDAEQEGGDVLLCDFGMADFIVSDQRDGIEPHSIGTNQNIGPADTSTSVAGSLQYAAPELFNAQAPVFSTAADIWAFGVVVYALLTAQLPFNEGLDVKTMSKIQQGDWDVELIRRSDAVRQGGSEDAVELVRGCLDMCPENRWTISKILNCSWLKGCEEEFESVPRPWTANS